MKIKLTDAVSQAAEMRASKLRAKIQKEAQITCIAIPEDMSIRGNCMASGDDKVDEDCALEIERQLNAGNEWAWCQVKVEARWNGLRGVDYLGGCSYASKADFMRPGDYYDDMLAQAIDQIYEQAIAIAKEVQ